MRWISLSGLARFQVELTQARPACGEVALRRPFLTPRADAVQRRSVVGAGTVTVTEKLANSD
jgi:hypothetical protein